MLEREIESAVVKYAKSKGFWERKFNSKGVPDRILISPTGLVGFIEFKKEGEELSKLQYHTCMELTDRNIDVRMIDDIILGRLVIDEWLHNKHNSKI
jgi:hypothetical protein